MSALEGWTREAEGVDIEVKGRRYRNMVEFSRPCKTCARKFSIHVTKFVADGKGYNNNFDLKNCPEHRQRHLNAVDAEQAEKLREELRNVNAYCSSMEQEQRDLLAKYQALFEENQAIKAKLAKYELPAALAAMDKAQAEPPPFIGCEAVQNTTASDDVDYDLAWTQSVPAFPWEH